MCGGAKASLWRTAAKTVIRILMLNKQWVRCGTLKAKPKNGKQNSNANEIKNEELAYPCMATWRHHSTVDSRPSKWVQWILPFFRHFISLCPGTVCSNCKSFPIRSKTSLRAIVERVYCEETGKNDPDALRWTTDSEWDVRGWNRYRNASKRVINISIPTTQISVSSRTDWRGQART